MELQSTGKIILQIRMKYLFLALGNKKNLKSKFQSYIIYSLY